MNVRCRIFGHNWHWPRLRLYLSPEGIKIAHTDRQCLRCHKWQRDYHHYTEFEIDGCNTRNIIRDNDEYIS